MRFVLWISALLGCVAASVFLLDAWSLSSETRRLDGFLMAISLTVVVVGLAQCVDALTTKKSDYELKLAQIAKALEDCLDELRKLTPKPPPEPVIVKPPRTDNYE